MVNTYMIIDGILYKDPTEEQIRNAPKEKIVDIKMGVIKNMIFEDWWTNLEAETSLDFAYYPDIVKDVKTLRRAFYESHGLTPICLKSLILPPSYFSEEGVKIPDVEY